MIVNCRMIFLSFIMFFGFAISQDLISGEDAPLPQDLNCYIAIGNPLIKLAVRFNNIPVPPPCMSMYGSVAITTPHGNNYIGVKLYFLLTSAICDSSLEVSNGNQTYQDIELFGMLNIGNLRLNHRFTVFTVKMYPNVQRGWHAYSDYYGIMQVYIKYRPNEPQVIPPITDVKGVSVASNLEPSTFQAENICVSYNYDVFVIKPNFVNKGTRSNPVFQGVRIRVYSNGQPVSAILVNAWPCGNDATLIESRKPTLVIDDVPNPQIYWTFDEFKVASKDEIHLYTMEELRNHIYFETDCQVELISSRSDWLSVRNRLFAVNFDTHLLTTNPDNNVCYRYRSTNGQRRYLMTFEDKVTYESAGYQERVYRRMGDGSKCDIVSSEMRSGIY